MVIKRFRLAKMSPGLLATTVVVLLIPLALAATAFAAPSPVHTLLLGTAAVLALLFAGTWLVGRPKAFDVGRDQLVIVWPARSRIIHKSNILEVQQLTADEFKRAYGRGMRIGAGGLWGGFGLLRTSGLTFSMWISRQDDLVIVTLKGARPLLITPAQPERFVAAIAALQRGDL